ncbi:NAD-dependent epimerase/dehydratase family protein [uncultured Mucilaginibacter sp.]|uniref:NAD-dependent epimerase/dehydratase family protein n=1 Tax=uncultured Mucilaginibacter sp. TaxID=797541 RepID=UPI0025F5D744|nr:NAD-dependent epimerase/dehydratase family protein [uncultured Mucilaginibacter sp.]
MILVTGATGFLGSVLTAHLVRQNVRVRCVKRSSSVIPDVLKPYAALIDWRDADILEEPILADAFEGISNVYHCAAWVSFKQADKEPMIYTNVTGTANIVNLCLEHNARLLHVSSIAAVGAAKPGLLTTEKNHIEETPVNNVYAISKLESEMEVWRGVAEGLDAVVINPSVIIGAAAGTAGSGKIFETVRTGVKYYSSGSCGLVDVDDVAKCAIALMNSNVTAERFIVNAENWKYKDLFEAAARCFGVKPPTTEAKPWMLELAWRGAAVIATLTGKDPSFDKIAAQAASVEQNYDNGKLKKVINIEFKPIAQSIREICEALKQ